MAGILMYDNWRKNKARDAFRFAHPDGRDFDYRNATTAVSKTWRMRRVSEPDVPTATSQLGGEGKVGTFTFTG